MATEAIIAEWHKNAERIIKEQSLEPNIEEMFIQMIEEAEKRVLQNHDYDA